MNPKYEFISNQRGKMIVQSQIDYAIHDRRAPHSGLPGKFMDKFGDVLIASGSWLKKISQVPTDENSVTVYPQS